MVRRNFAFGLIGNPVDHSLSPKIHRAALRQMRLPGEYNPYAVPALPAGQDLLLQLLEAMRADKIQGLNVTIPHKEKVISFLDDLTPVAEAICAVNTIYRRGTSLVGDNTDADGFYADLLTFEFPDSASRSALVLGAGGSARSVVYALVANGWKVFVASRRSEQARALIDSLQSAIRGSADNMELAWFTPDYLRKLPPIDLIVNTTPLGMVPAVEGSPWPEDIPFPPQASVYDLVYNPPVTRLVRAARSEGLSATGGSGMLVEQAALALERWTGVPAPRGAMRAAMLESTGEISHAK